MTRLKYVKLHALFKEAHPGSLLTSTWLKDHGIDHKLTWWYLHSGWLERIAERAYKRAGDSLSWPAVVASLQQQLKLPVHVGGKTALTLLGHSHYIPNKLTAISLFSLTGRLLPKWVNQNLGWDTDFEVQYTTLFSDDNIGQIKRSFNNIEISLSSPERAILEMFEIVSDANSLQESTLLLENLVNLRPKLLQTLLEKCQSIKVKRLFLYFSEQQNHSWRKELNIKKIRLGKGKRSIAGGGVYHAKYQLSLPLLEN